MATPTLDWKVCMKKLGFLLFNNFFLFTDQHKAYSLKKYLLDKWMKRQQWMNNSFLKVNSVPGISSVIHINRFLSSLFHGLAKNTQTCLTPHGKCGLYLSPDLYCMWYNLPVKQTPYGHIISLNLRVTGVRNDCHSLRIWSCLQKS